MNTTSNLSPKNSPCPNPQWPEIRLVVRGLGAVISFKNTKMLTKGKLITDPKKQEWMRRCVQSFVSQFISLCQTDDSGIYPECLKQYAIASLPLDDNWQELEIGRASCALTEKGNEGATIIIERI